MQPRYSEIEQKSYARLMNIKLFTELTGKAEISKGYEYWTLANEQPDTPGSEINQLVSEGFLSKEQFHGVDRDRSISIKNKLAHSKAHWYSGEWLEVISESLTFNPSLIYLDSVCFADSDIAISLLANTMLLTPPSTVLLFNSMASVPYASKKIVDSEFLVSNLHRYLPSRELDRWREDIPSFTYKTSRTTMRTYAFYKEI